MIRTLAIATAALTLTACAAEHPPLAEASGPYRALNVSHWTATADDLRGPRQPLLPVDSFTLNPPPAQQAASTPENNR